MVSSPTRGEPKVYWQSNQNMDKEATYVCRAVTYQLRDVRKVGVQVPNAGGGQSGDSCT